MTVVDTTVEVPADRRVTLQLPSDLPTGRLRLVAIVAADQGVGQNRDLPHLAPTRQPGEPIVIPIPRPDFGHDWDPDDTFRREEMYGDNGR